MKKFERVAMREHNPKWKYAIERERKLSFVQYKSG